MRPPVASSAAPKTSALDIAHPAVPASVRRFRHAMRDFASECGVENVPDVELAVTEACANAVVHAYVGVERGEIRLSAACRSDGLVVEVRDFGIGPRPRPDSPGLGLGLPTMGTVADRLEVEDADPGTLVRLTFRL